MQNIDIVQIVATIAAFAFAASKLLRATVPFWSSMPTWAQRFLPGALLVLGELPSALSGVTTKTDLIVAILGAIALALPGRHTNIPVPEKKEEKPVERIPPIGPAIALISALALVGASACSQGFSWPKVVESCAPAPADLIKEVTAILVSEAGELNDNALKELEDLGRKHSGEAVLCVVSSLVDDWTGKVGASKDELNGAARGRAFLSKTGSKVEQ